MSTPDPLTILQQVAQRNGNGPRVPRPRTLDATHQAVADVASELLLFGAAETWVGNHRDEPLTEPNERSAALRQHSYVASHRGVA
jgi:hypothetical protein